MKRELQKSAVDISTKNDLLSEIHRVWRNIELDYIRNLYQSIPDRLDNVIKMKGHLSDFKVTFAENGVKISLRTADAFSVVASLPPKNSVCEPE